MLHKVRRLAGEFLDKQRLPRSAKEEARRDRRLGLSTDDRGAERIIDVCIGWLGDAQDHSASRDGGCARDFSLINGWASSYPETTGYIVPTLLDHADLCDDPRARDRARRMLDWLASIQLPDGGFQGGKIDSEPVVPVTFNTGQILLGLASGVAAFGAYREAMRRAADWLVATQDPDGCWRKHHSPFAGPGDKTYDTHVAWGLLEAARQDPGRGYDDAALANIHWALGQQREGGWVDNCCLTDRSAPLTHTLGYFLRGVVEGYRYTKDTELLAAARRTADGLQRALGPDGFLPGRLRADWSGAVSWACLTGSVQVAHSWLLLYEATGEARYREAGLAANRYVRRTIRTDGPLGIRGGVKGSFPVDGDYGQYEYLNWAAKFCVDSNTAERNLQSRPASPRT